MVKEGSLLRSLFRSNSSSSDEVSDSDSDSDSDRDACETILKKSDALSEIDSSCQKLTSISTFMGNVSIAEVKFGSDISQRLWPAAEFLANFVLKFASYHTPHRTECCNVPEKAKERRTEWEEEGQSIPVISDRRPDGTDAIKRKLALTNLEILLTESFNSRGSTGIVPLQIIELGAGVGLVGIKIATELPCQILLTDLDQALPLLKKNVELNAKQLFKNNDKYSTVEVKKLSWGTDDWKICLDRIQKMRGSNCDNENVEVSHGRDCVKVLLLASECVYFEELHEPFEQTLADILSSSPEGSMCLISQTRRFKRDNTFYAKLGRNTRTATHGLTCVCVQEVVRRDFDGGKNDFGIRRQIMRVYAIQWIQYCYANK